jgi:hypothetical protein
MVMPRVDKLLLFDFGRHEVMTLLDQPLSKNYVALRDAFSQAVPSVRYCVLPDNKTLVEDMVEGKLVASLSPQSREKVYEDVLASLTSLTPTGRAERGHEILREAFFPNSGLPPESIVFRQRALAWLGMSPLVPSHGDLSPNNMFLANGSPLCIDFGAFEERPAWYDGVDLLYRAKLLDRDGPLPNDKGGLETQFVSFLRSSIPTQPPRDWPQLLFVGYQILSTKGSPPLASIA